MVSSHLKRLQIVTIADLLMHVPLHYITKKIEPNYFELKNDEMIVSTIKIIQVPEFKDKIKKFSGINNLGQQIELVFFANIPKFMWAYFKKGATLCIQGKVAIFNAIVQIAHPEIVFNKSLIKEIEPVYSLTGGISNAQIHRYILYCINALPEITTWHTLEEQLTLPSIRQSLINLHDPGNLNDINKYTKRLALEELLINQYVLAKVRQKNKTLRPAWQKDTSSYLQKVLTNLGFTLTSQQQEALAQISGDQTSNLRMIRMLQGDVGSGKTLIALLSMLPYLAAGAQTTLMAPTEILCTQHLAFFCKALQDTGFNIKLLSKTIKGKERSCLLDDLQNGKIDILIGTHALFQEKIIFSNLAYVVIDEQHRFGVQQRLDLLSKASNADLLLMSATPIPRSLSLVIYGDMDISYVRGKPKNNLPIITTVMASSKIDELTQSLQNIFHKQQKVYWICPLIEESEHKSYSNVISRHQELAKCYPGVTSLLHGGIPQAEKEQIMQEFKNGAINLLVATTVVEVGVDVPNATLIVIEDATSFGLSQLHQLRGRVGRSNLQSYCVLLYKAKALNKIAAQRLNILKNSNDGFVIAGQDLNLRGAGDAVGARQSGHDSFIFSAFLHDPELLEIAHQFITEHPELKADEEILRLFDKDSIAQHWHLA